MVKIASTIANGGTTGTAIKVDCERPVGLLMDATAWTSASLAFDVTFDETNWYPLCDPTDGNELSLTVAAQKYYFLDPVKFAGAISVRPRSSEAQGAQRVLTFVTLPFE